MTTYNLCRINMFLHDIDYDKFDIAHEDTLLNPQHWDDEPFEVTGLWLLPMPPALPAGQRVLLPFG